MLSEDQCDLVTIVLVSPRNPLNMGATARAMANFGFRRLAVVAPYEAHWREAQSAVGASRILQEAEQAATVAEAVRLSTLVIGTGTRRWRKPEQQVLSLPSLPPIVRRELDRGGRIAILFGGEKHGLTREELARCHLLVEIPTDSRQPSMNLGQAAAVCLYELATRAGAPAQPPLEASADTGPAGASAAILDLLASVILETMTEAGYSPPSMRSRNRHDLVLFLRRLVINPADARRMLGVFRRILWRLRRMG